MNNVATAFAALSDLAQGSQVQRPQAQRPTTRPISAQASERMWANDVVSGR